MTRRRAGQGRVPRTPPPGRRTPAGAAGRGTREGPSSPALARGSQTPPCFSDRQHNGKPQGYRLVVGGYNVGLRRRKKGVSDYEVAQSLDRKSTRLNSSHANISYAVFCLK